MFLRSVRTLKRLCRLKFALRSPVWGQPTFDRAAPLGMLMFMRALPGRASRATLDAPPASVTRSSAHADQRRRILRAVGELVAERGYSDVTVELIVKRARVSFKTFYK